MSEANRSWLLNTVVLCGLGVAIFIVGAVTGYGRGAFGIGGTVERGFDWAVKTGLLLLVTSAVLGAFGGLILAKLQLPAFIGWALVMGLTFAIMNGGGILLGMNDNAWWSEIVKGLLSGALVGAISGAIIHRRQTHRTQPTRPDSKFSADQNAP